MKILIFSNNCLSHSNSNGRTMNNMLGEFNKSDIYNIYIHGILDDANIANFYRINEIYLFKKPFSSKLITPVNKEGKTITANKTGANSVIKRLIRIIIWKNAKLKKQTKKLVNKINPDVIVIQCGDSSFLINLSIYISKLFKIPLISFNTEDYIFKDWNYFTRTNHKNLFFKIFQNNLKKTYNKLYNLASSHVYLTKKLQTQYLERYPNHNSCVIYNSSNLNVKESKNKGVDYLYLGNVTQGREESLIEFSKILYKYLNKKLNVYTESSNKSILELLRNTKTIQLNKAVSYEKCLNLIQNCQAVIHVENLGKFYIKDSINAFSTKIADCLSSGKPFILIAPKESFVYQYIKERDCAFAFSSFDELSVFIQHISKDNSILYSKLENQAKTALQNHSSQINSKLFFEALKKAILNK